MIGVGVVGCGYWGPNLIRNFDEIPDCRLTSVCDLRSDRLAFVKSSHPKVDITADYAQLLADPRIDAIAVATPVASHYDLALRALSAGKHVLVEKPMTASSGEALRLIGEADRRGLVLAVDHTFVHTGAVRAIKSLVESNQLGDIYCYDSTRVNSSLIPRDVNVVWDLAVHDLSIMDELVPSRPWAVSARATSRVAGHHEDHAYVTCFFEGNLTACIHVDWMAPLKIRRTLIGGSRKTIVYDDLEPTEKVKVYDGGGGVTQDGASAVRPWAPELDTTEPLRVALAQFLSCIEQTAVTPTADGHAGLRMVYILEAATRSMRECGRVVEIEAAGCTA
jgi:predicted dehydrogenase